jgi:hypothetical protein
VVRDILETLVEPDGMRFDPATVAGTLIRERQEYEGVRLHFQGSLQQARILVRLDVGFGDVIVPGPQLVDYPTILPGLSSPRLRGYSRESVVAEKFEAMVALGEINTRYKDFYDLWFLARRFDFDGALLARAVAATFERRATTLTATPVAWTDVFAGDPDRQAQWRAFLRRTGVADAPETLGELVTLIRAFLGPVAAALLPTIRSRQNGGRLALGVNGAAYSL